MSEPVTLTPDVYWRLRAKVGDVQAAKARAEAEFQQKAQAAITEAGLTSGVNYTLNDDDLTATPEAAS